MKKEFLFSSIIKTLVHNTKNMPHYKSIASFLVMIILCSSSNLKADNGLTLSNNGNSQYSIVYDEASASPTDKNAVKELNEYLQKITGATFPVIKLDKVLHAKNKRIIVGSNQLSRKFFGNKFIKSLGDEEFVIKSDANGDIYIVGGKARGTLYGVYHFLDNILGVRWLSPDAEFVPDKANLKISPLDVHEKPAFILRRNEYFIHTDPEADYKWLMRNRFSGTVYNYILIQNLLKTKKGVRLWSLKNKIELPYEKYGRKNIFAPPFFVHTLSRLIPAKKYFKAHPEWWEKINGKRVNKGRRSAMCLTNQGLIDETAKNAITQIDSYPDSEIISISDNDQIVDYCKCQKCRSFMKKHGNTESALLLNFVNHVAKKIHKKYPDIMVDTLAYIKTEKSPKNIKAGKNIIVRLCTWGASHAVPYSDARNTKGIKLLEELKKWKKICPNIGIWDYAATYKLNLIPNPNLNTIIPNLKSFHQAGVDDYFFEADHNQGGYHSGESLARAFLMSRGLWNPNLSTAKVIKDFTNAYYGKKAGKYVRQYWALLSNSNRKAKYIFMFQNGNLGEAPYLKINVILKADKLLKKAMQAAKSKQQKEHVQQLHMQINYVLLYKYRKYEADAKMRNLKMPVTFKTLFANFEANTKKYGVLQINKKSSSEVLSKLKKYYYMDFTVRASNSYGSKPEAVFDDDLRTLWNGGEFSSWVEIKFSKPKLISSIYTIFSRTDIKADYTILGSMDGKKWQTLVPRRTTTSTKIMQEIHPRYPTMFADDKIKPTKVLHLKTKIFKMLMQNGKRNWIVLREQSIR